MTQLMHWFENQSVVGRSYQTTDMQRIPGEAHHDQHLGYFQRQAAHPAADARQGQWRAWLPCLWSRWVPAREMVPIPWLTPDDMPRRTALPFMPTNSHGGVNFNRVPLHHRQQVQQMQQAGFLNHAPMGSFGRAGAAAMQASSQHYSDMNRKKASGEWVGDESPKSPTLTSGHHTSAPYYPTSKSDCIGLVLTLQDETAVWPHPDYGELFTHIAS